MTFCVCVGEDMDNFMLICIIVGFIIMIGPAEADSIAAGPNSFLIIY